MNFDDYKVDRSTYLGLKSPRMSFKYRLATQKVREDVQRKRKEFRRDLEILHGVPHDHEKAFLLWEKAWSYGKGDLGEVAMFFLDMVDLLTDLRPQGI